AGAAGLGVARQIKTQLAEEGSGDAEELLGRVAVLDRHGLLVDDGRIMDPYKRELAWTPNVAARFGLDDTSARMLLDVVKRYRPTMLIGVSGAGGAFTEEVVREMAAHVERPVIFPSSTPSAVTSAGSAYLFQWTDCRCLVAAGGPFGYVDCGGRRYKIGQGNKLFLFPGLGLGALAARERRVTDGMTNAASKALAHQVTDDECD